MHFGFCVFALHAAHIMAADCFVVDVRHAGEFKVSSTKIKVNEESLQSQWAGKKDESWKKVGSCSFQ